MEGLQSNKPNLLFGFVVTNFSEFQLLKVARRHALVSVYCFCNKLLVQMQKVINYYLNNNGEEAKGKPPG